MLTLCYDPQANANMNDLAKRLKQSENLNIDLQRRVDELSNELQAAHGDNQRLQVELARLRVTASELQERADALARENKQLSGENRRPLEPIFDKVTRVGLNCNFLRLFVLCRIVNF